ncbi:hypothetical protein GALMADRAFT_136941 [Galerina marginata CBS 339.88]|uniref:Uncharacterized protein n=1 Tax=Galerina marginata (strain CBS 339.88) TaxID=685588 RepID=A0A067TBH5_GALM3|nr:hypothetical protein GALMADRAFT_136941 [Galerina marginata CBS 339.88]
MPHPQPPFHAPHPAADSGFVEDIFEFTGPKLVRIATRASATSSSHHIESSTSSSPTKAITSATNTPLPPVDLVIPKSQPDPFPNQVPNQFSSNENHWFSPPPIPPPFPSFTKAAAKVPIDGLTQLCELVVQTSSELYQDEARRQLYSPLATPRVRKLSELCNNSDNSFIINHPTGSSATLQSSPEPHHRLHNGSYQSLRSLFH